MTHAGGLVTILTGLPFDWFNQVLVERAQARPEDAVAAVARARERGDHFVVPLRQGIDDRFLRTLAQAGLEPGGTTTPGMIAFPIDHDAIGRCTTAGFEIRRVTEASGIDVHCQVVTAGFASDRAVALGTAWPDLRATRL